MPTSKAPTLVILLFILASGSTSLADPGNQWDHAPPQTIQVEITTHLGDQQHFRQGDTVSFLLSLEREAYIYLLYLDAAGDHLQLLPNQHQRAAHYPAGVFMPIPSADAPFQFVIDAPFGEETLWVLASSTPWPALQGGYLANGLFRPTTNPEQTLARLYEHVRSAHTAFGQARLRLQTEQ